MCILTPAISVCSAAFLSAYPVTIPFMFVGPVSIAQAILFISFPVFVLKQIISVVQLFTAVNRILALDEEDKQKVLAKAKAA
jgi:hypothetical protein